MAQTLADATRAGVLVRGNRNAGPPDEDRLGREASDLAGALGSLIGQGDARITRLRDAGKPRVFIVSGPSGVGKDAVIERLQVCYPDAHYVVTATTRPVRPGEIDGEHYHFLDKDEFLTRLGAGDFLEHAIVYGNHYGVPRGQVVEALHAGRDVIIKVDVKGAATLRERISNPVSIFLAPESMDELLLRLRKRKTEDPEVLVQRFATAEDELTRADEFDYVVFNEAGKLDTTLDQLCHIIDSEHRRLHLDPVEVN